MRPADRCVLLCLVTACNRSPTASSPGQAEPATTTGAPEAAKLDPPAADPTGPAVALAHDDGPTKVEPLRPGPDEVDRALLLRLRRHVDAALKLEALVRDGDAWLVAYTYDELDAWWRGVHRAGDVARVRAELRRRRLACEAAFRHPDEDPSASTGALDDFDLDPDNAMDERSCWQRALASVAPRDGAIDGDCLALAVARVTATDIAVLWSLSGECVEPPADFRSLDIAGAGWPQLVLQVQATRWDMTRLGFQAADRTSRLVVLDPRKPTDAVMLEQVMSHETLVDEAWRWTGSYAHVDFKPGKHLTVLEQTWSTSDECEVDPSGWAVADADDEADADCTVEWSMRRTPWDPAAQRWSGKAEKLPRPKRPPTRDEALPIALPGAP